MRTEEFVNVAHRRCPRLAGHAFRALLVFLLAVTSLPAEESLQSAVNRLMRERRGAVIASDPRTGRILALWNARGAFEDAYPPGSTAKLVEAVALLEEKKISGSDRIHCRRVPELLGESHRCSHPVMGFAFDLKSALAYSCNYFFAAESVRLTSSSLLHWYTRFGFGTPVDVAFTAANPGDVRVPDDVSAKARAALGEDTVLVTPAQMLLAYSAIAPGGKVFRLWRSGSPPKKIPRVVRKLALRPETLEMINSGLEECVRSGTGQGAAVAGLRVAGKTGTAALGLPGRTHAWFVGYAPADAPEIALVVFLEQGTGARDAAPLAGEILRHYFALKSRKP